MFERYEMSAIYDSRKSFYGKAEIEKFAKWVTLYSYKTKICTLDTESGKVEKFPHYSSQTTTRHIKEFCKQFDIDYAEYCKA